MAGRSRLSGSVERVPWVTSTTGRPAALASASSSHHDGGVHPSSAPASRKVPTNSTESGRSLRLHSNSGTLGTRNFSASVVVQSRK
jgi:hypothetical protein